MPAYTIAHLRSVDVGADILRTYRRSTRRSRPITDDCSCTAPSVEGEWPGKLVIIEFPDRERATAWYESPEYQAILPLRTENSEGSAIIVDGVAPGYRAAQLLQSIGSMPA